MTQEQIDMIDKATEYAKQGYLIDTTWSFAGYTCRVWELHQDHDSDIEVEPKEGIWFNTRWDALKAGIEYIAESRPSLSNKEETIEELKTELRETEEELSRKQGRLRSRLRDMTEQFTQGCPFQVGDKVIIEASAKKTYIHLGCR